MSEFDKEAEREKLREKYGEESDEREATRQMSELLLQGATMTNQHCDICGDPIFRYDGQEFCPTCQEAASADGEGETDAEANAVGESPAGAADHPAQDQARTAERDPRTAADAAPTGDAGSDDAAPTADPDRVPVETPTSAASETAPDQTPADPPSDTADLAAARRSLERTVSRFARAAETTEDPRVARDHLAAAREAAEALSALRR